MGSIFDSLKKRRAMYAHTMAYLHESTIEDSIDDCTEKVERKYMRESNELEAFQEAAQMLEEMPEAFEHEDAAEINRMMEATEDLSFDKMIGIK